MSFTLRKGEVLGVGGLVGQGQTQLFLSLFGILKAHGTILVNGKRASSEIRGGASATASP